MTGGIHTLFRRLCRHTEGSVAIVVAVSMIGLIGVTGLMVDVGLVYHYKAELQASSDAAALAGAQDINYGQGGTAVNTAIAYSGVAGQKNADSHLSTTMATGYPVLKCLSSTGISCDGPDSANAIEVKEQATVPSFFARLFGVDSFHISATSLASKGGGANGPADVEVVLDTTGSMNSWDSSCSMAYATRLDCAMAGVRTLLGTLSPCSAKSSSCGAATNGNVQNPVDRVGLMVFPGLTKTNQVPYEYDCSSSPRPAISKYSGNPVYNVVPLSSDYRTSDSASTLDTSSNVVLASRGGSSGCTQGVDAIGGVGTFYADAITAAQNDLAANGRSTAQKVIILLSDGDANARTSDMPGSEKNNQCHEAITAAQNATAAGTTVYTIAYGASTSSTSSCSTDSSAISACATLQQMASSSSDFYSDNTGGSSSCAASANPISDLSQIFEAIGQKVSSPRLLPLGTT